MSEDIKKLEELRRLFSKRRPFEDKNEDDEDFLKRRLFFDDEDDEKDWLGKKWIEDDWLSKKWLEEPEQKEVEKEDKNIFSKVLLEVVEEIAKVYSAKPRENLTFIVEDIEVSEEERQKLLSVVKEHIKECADPLRHKDIILCLLEKAGTERLLRAYKERNKENVVLLARLIRI